MTLLKICCQFGGASVPLSLEDSQHRLLASVQPSHLCYCLCTAPAACYLCYRAVSECAVVAEKPTVSAACHALDNAYHCNLLDMLKISMVLLAVGKMITLLGLLMHVKRNAATLLHVILQPYCEYTKGRVVQQAIAAGGANPPVCRLLNHSQVSFEAKVKERKLEKLKHENRRTSLIKEVIACKLWTGSIHAVSALHGVTSHVSCFAGCRALELSYALPHQLLLLCEHDMAWKQAI